jgi:hypothetical protein
MKIPSSGNRGVLCGRTDCQTDATKLTVAFPNFVNAPKNTVWTEGLTHRITQVRASRQQCCTEKDQDSNLSLAIGYNE